MRFPMRMTREYSRCRRGARGVTFRVVVLSLCLAVFFGYVIPIIDVKLSNTFLGAQNLPPGAIGALLALLLIINPMLRVLAKRRMFSRNEILTVYITCLFSCLVPGHGSESFLVSNVVAGFYYATPENGWLGFLQHLPRWMTPALSGSGKYDAAAQRVVVGWYEGTGGVVPWSAWLVPLLAWSAACIALYVMLGCLSVILRAQWAKHEALSFPLLRLPLEMTEDVDDPQAPIFGKFFRNPLMWVGFSIAVLMQGLNGLHLYFSDVPRFWSDFDLAPYFSDAPWNQMGGAAMQLYPIAVGITFLLTSEVSFSLWFFFWIIKIQYVVAYYLGYMPGSLPGALGAGDKIFTGYQTVGAYLAYAAVMFWVGRSHYVHVAKRAFGMAARTREERGEALSYPVAFWGFVLSSLFLCGWCAAAGIGIAVAAMMWFLYLVMALGLARVAAEGGLLYVGNSWRPLGVMAQLTGSGAGTWIAPGSIPPGGLVSGAFMTDMRGFILPSFIYGLKLSHDRGIARRPLMALIAAVIFVTLAMGLLMRVKMGYQSSALTFHTFFAMNGARISASSASTILKGAPDVSWTNWLWMLLGGGFTLLVMALRARFAWFALNPMGYLMCLTYPIITLWFSIFLGWLAKVLITRFGGNSSYRAAIPLFLGLALGDVFMMLFWLCIDGWQGRVYHYLVPT